MPDLPNVLLLIDDQHRPDVMGYAGNDVVRTPNIDRLADTGTVFTNAYTPAPCCVPARHSLRTGKLPRTWDRDGFDAFEQFDYPTLPRHFSQHGYATVNAGQVHYPGKNIMQGWRKQLGPTPWGMIGESMIDVQDETGFERRREFSEYKWSDVKEIKRAGLGKSQVYSKDSRSIRDATEFLHYQFTGPHYDRHQPDQPLLLKVAPNRPHVPFLAASEDRFSYYLNRVDPFVEPPDDLHPNLTRHPVVPGEEVSEREIRRATAAYYAMVEEIDDQFGDVLDAVEHAGEDLDDWIVVVTSDHGEMLGDHGVWQKSTFYEGSVRVPLVIRYPERFDPATVEENVSLYDLHATLCDLAGLPLPEGTDSRSLAPLMAGDTRHWHEDYHNEAVSQYADNSSVGDGIEQEDLMIKRDDLKYCYYTDDDGEVLFDLDRDPGETTNLVDDPAYAEDLRRFRERRGELGYGPNADPDYRNAGY